MNKLPLKAIAYIVAVYVCALAVVLHVALGGLQHHVSWWTILLFQALAVVAGSKKITLSAGKGSSSMSMSLGFSVTFAAILYCGPGVGMLITLMSILLAGLRKSKQTAYQLLFNASLSAIEAYLAGIVFLALHGSALMHAPLRAVPALCASCLTFFLVNTIGVALVIALCSNQKPAALWRKTFSWTAPSYFAGAGVSTLAIYICGANMLYVAIFLAPVVFLSYQSYTTTRARSLEQQKHVDELQKRQAELADLYLATIKSLALAIDAKDQYTHQHILRVQRYAVAVAVEMGLTGDELEGLTTGALLHDIGKLGVPEYVLLKPGRLSDDEFAKIKKHPEIGAAILGPVEFPWPVLPVVKYHHEKWDGTGYPEGLKGENIPLTARILAVADVYDALTSTRSYRSAWEHRRAVQRIVDDAGVHFDPVIVDAFVRVIDGVVEELAREQKALADERADEPAGAEPGGAAGVSHMAVREIQQASSELWALYEVAQSLSSSLGLTETLDILARKLQAIAPPGVACVFLLFDGNDDGALGARSVLGVNAPFLSGSRTINEHSASMTVARTRRSYCGEYDTDDLLITSTYEAQWENLNSALIVPIVHEGSVLGTINLYHPSRDAFLAHDQELLETIAERAAMAIYNGLMFDRTRSHAMTDPLTGLYNFRYLTQMVDEMCQPRREEDLAQTPDPFALICLDLDDFKPINDNFGHQKGDEVLRDLSALLRGCVRVTDIVARYGGDEFLIVLVGAGEEQAARVAAEIQASVAAYDPGLTHATLGSLRLGASLGWSCFPAGGSDCTTLLASADDAMYRNKTDRKLRRLAGPQGGESAASGGGGEVIELPRAA